MLLMKSRCETCGKNLPPSTREARICSFECTFCEECATNTHGSTCPNCKGQLVQRPTRADALMEKYPPSDG